MARCARSLAVALLLLSTLAVPGRGLAIDPRPDNVPARWSGEVWGRIRTVPAFVRHGDEVQLHGTVVGGPAADPWWSCSQYSGWVANGTSQIVLVAPGDWQMPNSTHDYFDNLVNIKQREAGELPPYGYANRLSETCYCEVTTFGAQGGCATREHQPKFFHLMDPFNPREGNVQFAKVNSGAGWVTLQARFSGRAGVGWDDTASDFVYVIPPEGLPEEDSDGDGLPDAWELAHSPNQDLGDFGGSPSGSARAVRLEAAAWVNPYAPKDPGWVRAAAGDWDGDGVSDRDEYARWRDRKVDGDGAPYDPTYLNAPAKESGSSGCGAGAGGGGALLAAGLVAAGLASARRRRR